MLIDTKINNLLNLISYQVGRNINLTQGAGGNISYKSGDSLWIKASVFWLSEALTKQIFIPLDIHSLKAIKTDKNSENLKPSIETSLHVIMPHDFVIHAHSINSMFFSIHKQGESLLRGILKGYNWKWIKYTKPGKNLASEIEKNISSNQNVDILILENHGIVIGSNSIKECYSKLLEVEKLLELASLPQVINTNPYPINKSFSFNGYSFIENIDAKIVSRNNSFFDYFRSGFVIPDQIVYLDKNIKFLLNSNNLDKFVKNKQKYDILVVKDLGVLISSFCPKNTEEIFYALCAVLIKFHSKDDISFLSEFDVESIRSWDSEKYRKKLIK